MNNKHIIVYFIIFFLIYLNINKLKPNYSLKIFENYIFKLLILVLIYFIMCYDLYFGLIISVMYILTHINMTNKTIKKNFNQLEHFVQFEHFSNNLI